MAQAAGPLARTLSELTRAGEIYERLQDAAVRCHACGHRCLIPAGRPGICKVRFNEGGTLKVPWGYVGALQCDPVEKKPFFHALPGALALSFGMLGCDFHCAYCQNWITSQAIRDPKAVSAPERVSPADLVALAGRSGAPILASTYNEPLITSEWAVAIFREAVEAGLVCAYISNGNGTEQVLEYIRPYVRLYKVDLKSFRDRSYRGLGGTLRNVLDTIVLLKAKGFWLEIVTLLIPGFNDSNEEITDMARFLAGVSPDIPWHVTAFHKDYRMTDPDDTPASTLLRAASIGREEGLRFVYAGNIPGAVGDFENTRCPGCDAILVGRLGYRILEYRISRDGTCPACGLAIPGLWRGGAFHGQTAGPGR
ncbi:MAG TPA: AmmeMemoRadiSam system radical SAM enzyme [Candidatus Polarisedimenticolia bacterium]|jgi:pyruvate formate lyase activating enzyme|nr:AmmeMemoRadiSam system radical SAM enzyme [Candidatus Polarisedimenticolia bacterium]